MVAPPPLPFGAWPSPITTELVVRGAAAIAEVVVDGEDVWWSEMRPEEGGRTTLLRRRTDGHTDEVTPAPTRVRTMVHEYGGGAWWVQGGIAVYSEGADGQLRRLDDRGAVPVTATPEARFADGRLTPDGSWFVCVRELHDPLGGTEPRNEVVAVATNGSGRVQVLVSGPDFVAAPRPSPDGRRLAWLQWDHPDMPWDGTELWVAEMDGAEISASRRLAGGPDESLLQPEWSPAGELHVLSDRDDRWHLYRVERDLVPVRTGDFEIGGPPWALGGSSYALAPSGRAVCDVDVVGTLSDPHCLRALGEDVVVAGADWRSESQVLRISPGGATAVLRPPRDLGLAPSWFPPPEPITFPTGDGEVAHGLFYRPANPEATGPAGSRPPLVVMVHGGPTGSARRSLHLGTRFWTSRGLAVVDVDYRGSSGYGRRYRKLLEGRWGEADVEDCMAAARHLAGRGDVDPERLAIRGSSAGGFTVLSALVAHDTFAAGTVLYGVADLEALARDTHKFESRYLDRLIGPYPDAAARWRARSPIRHLDRLRTPLLVMQGLDDAVVPPNQSQSLVDALAANGVPHAYLAFAGEAHGFRRAETIVAALEAELSFYGQILGFEPADAIDPVPIRR